MSRLDPAILARIPTDVIAAERRVSDWFEGNNVKSWELGGSRNRSPAPTQGPGERTASDRAIEHAEYMAASADQLLASIELLSEAEQKREEAEDSNDDGTVADARDTVWDHIRHLRSRVYEFRKRRERALLDSPKQPRATGERRGRPMTLRECMEAEESTPAREPIELPDATTVLLALSPQAQRTVSAENVRDVLAAIAAVLGRT